MHYLDSSVIITMCLLLGCWMLGICHDQLKRIADAMEKD